MASSPDVDVQQIAATSRFPLPTTSANPGSPERPLRPKPKLGRSVSAEGALEIATAAATVSPPHVMPLHALSCLLVTDLLHGASRDGQTHFIA